MRLKLNGEAVELPPGTTLVDVVARRAEGQRRVAVALNGEVVRRSDWATTVLVAGDAVEVLVAVAGG